MVLRNCSVLAWGHSHSSLYFAIILEVILWIVLINFYLSIRKKNSAEKFSLLFIYFLV